MDFFDTSNFPARWHCGNWSNLLGWMHIISDLVIFAAYMAIPIVIVAYMRKRREVMFPAIFWIFVIFIFSCGTTHLLEAIIFWYPLYPVAGLVKMLTAIASALAVLIAIKVMPQALSLPGMATINKQLTAEIAARIVSEQRVAQQAAALADSQRRLIAAQAIAHIGDWTYDVANDVISWSEEVFRLFERDPALGPPQTYAENARLYLPEGNVTVAAAMRQAEGQAGEPVTIEIEVPLPSGGTAWHRSIMRAIPDSNGKITQYWGTVQDITREKLSSLAEKRQLQDLERINQQLEQFAYIASHDLTEPLRKVRFFSDVLKEEIEGSLTVTATDALSRMSTATDRMHRLVQDLLAFARSGKSLEKPRPVNLERLLDEVLDTLSERIAATGAKIERGPLPDVLGDQGLLEQVFQNVLTNALKYRHHDRSPMIAISCERSAGMAVISIRDNGLGFHPEQAGRLFEPFVRLHRASGEDGTGIGLAICRRILEVHGGSITAIPAPDHGAIFTVRIPVALSPRSP